MASTRPFSLLFVCTGNIARSPLAAACTMAVVSGNGQAVPWEVDSAGTHAIDGDTVRPEVQKIAAGLGIDLSTHRATALTPERCLEPDLILAMSWDQVAHIWSLVPEAWDRCFTLKEFVHWAKQAPVRPPILFANHVDQMRDKVVQAHSIRKRARADNGFWGGMRPEELDLIEPNGRGEAAWQHLGRAVRALCTDAIRLVGRP